MTLLTILFMAAVAFTTPTEGAVSDEFREVRETYNAEYRELSGMSAHYYARTGINLELPKRYTSDSYDIEAMNKKIAEFRSAKESLEKDLFALDERARLRITSDDSVQVFITNVVTECEGEDPMKGISSSDFYARGTIYKTPLNRESYFVPIIFREDFVLSINLDQEFLINPLHETVQSHEIKGTFLQDDNCNFRFMVNFAAKNK